MEICNKVTAWNKTMKLLKTSSSELRLQHKVNEVDSVKQLAIEAECTDC